MVGHGGSSAGSYLAEPTSPIPSHCASIVATSTVRVKVTNMKRQMFNLDIWSGQSGTKLCKVVCDMQKWSIVLQVLLLGRYRHGILME